MGRQEQFRHEGMTDVSAWFFFFIIIILTLHYVEL